MCKAFRADNMKVDIRAVGHTGLDRIQNDAVATAPELPAVVSNLTFAADD